MKFLLSLQTALSNLRTNKMRTALTMLGIIIGVSSVIIMVAIVEGARYSVVQEFERMGSDLILILYMPERQEQRGRIVTVQSLTMDDVQQIREECHLLRNVSAEVSLGSTSLAKYRDREVEVDPTGAQPDYLRLRNFNLLRGRSITEEDEQNWAKVCVLGSVARKKLFDQEDPLGQTIEVNGIALTVVGTLEAKGGNGPGQQDDKRVILPISTVQKRLNGSEMVNVIYAQPRSSEDLDAALEQVWECLMRHHDNAPGFRVDSQANLLESIGRILNVFGMVLGGIAGMALLVGGIGIMNIMLVSVTERTREIGIRKAVGARSKDILWQFLIESATVSGIGGLAGIAMGASAAFGVAAITAKLMPPRPDGTSGLVVHLPIWVVLGAFAFSACIGVFFGIYPAMRAAKLDPIQALRHE